ncbi:MAG: Hsp20/alpha crystallin family protein [Candidatus Methanoperedens sp.]
MKKIKDFNDILRQLEEVLEEMAGDIGIPKDRPVSIDVSINMCPYMDFEGIVEVPRHEEKIPVDILETGDSIHVVAGIPGIGIEDIELDCTGWALGITALNPGKTVREIVELPVKVNKTGMKTTYRNGILEVVCNKSKRQGRPGR